MVAAAVDATAGAGAAVLAAAEDALEAVTAVVVVTVVNAQRWPNKKPADLSIAGCLFEATACLLRQVWHSGTGVGRGFCA